MSLRCRAGGIRKYHRPALSLRSLLLGALGGSEIGSNRLQDQGSVIAKRECSHAGCGREICCSELLPLDENLLGMTIDKFG